MARGWHNESEGHSEAARQGWANRLRKPRTLVDNMGRRMETLANPPVVTGPPVPTEYHNTYGRVEELLDEHELILKRIESEYGSMANFNKAVAEGDEQAFATRTDLLNIQQKLNEGMYILGEMDENYVKAVDKDFRERYPRTMMRIDGSVQSTLCRNVAKPTPLLRKRRTEEDIVAPVPEQVVYNQDRGNYQEESNAGFEDTDLGFNEEGENNGNY